MDPLRPTPPPGSGSWRRTGRVFAGRFELQEELGRGGVGVVMRATDLHTGQEVALKVLRDPALGASVVAERLRREGQAAAGLDHPGIVRLLASGEAGGLPWLAFELVPGCRTLTRAWRGLDLTARVRLVRDAAAALGFAHRRGVVHRDVKPGNLLVDAQGKLRVTDFGVALSEDWERITRSGVMLGTPTHMAPEQIETRRGAIGPWSDVWALGVILYQAMTGELPFSGETLLEISARVVEARLTPPRGIAPEVPPALEQVCLSCLALNPRDRPLDGEVLVRRLEEALSESAPPARRRPRWAPVLAGSIVGAALLLAAALVVARRGSRGDPQVASVTSSRPSSVPGPGASPDTAWLGSASLAELRAAAASGFAPAWTVLGRAHREGTFAPPDLSESRRCFERAAALEDPEGAVELARLLRAEGDLPGARRWLELAAGKDALHGRVELARMLAAGEGGPADPARAVRVLVGAREQDHPALLAALAQAAEEGWEGEPDLARAAGLWRRAAQGGSLPGMLGWARVLENGLGVAEDDAAAASWYRRAGEAGSALAMAQYALMLGDGSGVPEDQAAARRWLEEAAAKGELLAGYALGLYVSAGIGGPRDEPRARELYRQAAERGHVESMAKLGEMLLDGKGGAKDPLAGRVWLERAARTGDPEGMRRYGLALWLGKPSTPQEREEGQEWIQRSALAGHPQGMTFWGVIVLTRSEAPADKAEGREWLEKAAARGEPVAMYELAWRLEKGVDFPRDRARSRHWLEQAALHHHNDAQLELGLILCGEQGDPPAWERARGWLEQAAEGRFGKPEAMVRLSELVGEGRGGPRDPARADALLRRAAELGHGGASLRLGSQSFERGDYEAALELWLAAGRAGQADGWMGVGLLHMRGQGVERDALLAAQAFQEANKLGNRDGAVWLARVLRQGGPRLAARPGEALALMREIAEDSGDPLACASLGAWLLEDGGPGAAEARAWLLRAAEAGEVAAMERLAAALRAGEGGPVDEVAAARWEREAQQARAREEQE